MTTDQADQIREAGELLKRAADIIDDAAHSINMAADWGSDSPLAEMSAAVDHIDAASANLNDATASAETT